MQKSRQQHWEKIYSTKQPHEVSWTQETPAISLYLFHQAQLPKTTHIIDIGGGDSKFVDFLIKEGFENITVLDISKNALERAKKRLGKKAMNVNWIVSDILSFAPATKFDYWHDRAVFHFLTQPDDIEKYLSILQKVVKPSGFLSLGTFSEQGPNTCSGLPVCQYTIETLTQTIGKAFKKINCLTEDHLTPFGTKQHFLFCLFQKN